MVLQVEARGKLMVTISLKVSEEDKAFIQYMAKFEGKTMSELIREKTIEALEDEYDRQVAEKAYAEYQEDLANGVEPMTWEEAMAELGLADETV